MLSLYIFFDCAGSSLLHRGFLQLHSQEGYSPAAEIGKATLQLPRSGRLLSSCGDQEGYSPVALSGRLLSRCGDREGYSPVARSGRLLSSCGVHASPCRGLSCGQVWTPGHMDFSSCGGGACCPAACGIFWAQDGTCVPCISRRILNHLTAR